MIKDTFSPYSFEEASNFGDGFPKRGVKCKKCGVIIPSFSSFGELEIIQWKSILKNISAVKADEYIMSITGCNSRWAKIWRLHPNGALSKVAPLVNSAKCPSCGKALRTIMAKQCPHCFERWG